MPETSPARIEANRRNAAKSTGPRTPEGKARSRRNAWKHGLCAEALVVDPLESADDYKAHLRAWFDDARPVGIIEQTLAEHAARAAWKLRRADRRAAAAGRQAVRAAVDEVDASGRDAAVTLGRRLLRDPFNRCAPPPRHAPEFRDKVRQLHEDDPALLAPLLERDRHGVDWKLDEWAKLARALELTGFWHYDERFAALRLAGHRPEDVLRDAVVERLTLACNVLHPEAWTLWDDCHQASMGLDDRPLYVAKVLLMEERRPATPEEALDVLWDYLDGEVARLRALKADGLDARADAERADAAAAALVDDGPTAPLHLRYEAAAERSLFKSLAELAKLQKARGDDRGAYESVELFPNEPRPAAKPQPTPAPRPAPETKPGPARPRRRPPTIAELDALATDERLGLQAVRAREEAEERRRREEEESPLAEVRRKEARLLDALEERTGVRYSAITL